jgi:hypothetical protein
VRSLRSSAIASLRLHRVAADRCAWSAARLAVSCLSPRHNCVAGLPTKSSTRWSRKPLPRSAIRMLFLRESSPATGASEAKVAETVERELAAAFFHSATFRSASVRQRQYSGSPRKANLLEGGQPANGSEARSSRARPS